MQCIFNYIQIRVLPLSRPQQRLQGLGLRPGRTPRSWRSGTAAGASYLNKFQVLVFLSGLIVEAAGIAYMGLVSLTCQGRHARGARGVARGDGAQIAPLHAPELVRAPSGS